MLIFRSNDGNHYYTTQSQAIKGVAEAMRSALRSAKGDEDAKRIMKAKIDVFVHQVGVPAKQDVVDMLNEIVPDFMDHEAPNYDCRKVAQLWLEQAGTGAIVVCRALGKDGVTVRTIK